MAEINLSKAVRSNLLSLQSTADSMAKTQQRLATGLKVNSALDNPTNFFTSSALNSRASDMSNLLDSMSSGIKVIEAADNGLSSITKTVESMQSTLRQARQDKSFKTQSFAIDSTTIGTSASKTLTFAGGAVGEAAVAVELNTLAGTSTATTLTGSGASFGSLPNGASISVDGTNIAISDMTAAVPTTLVGEAPVAATYAGEVLFIAGTNVAIPSNTSADGVKALIDAAGIADLTVAVNAGVLEFTRPSGADLYIVASGNSFANAMGLTVDPGDPDRFSSNGTPSGPATLASVQAELDAALGSGYTVGNNGTELTLSKADGTDIVLGGDDALLTAIGFASGNRSSSNGVEGTLASVKSVDALVTEINANTSLAGKVRASNDAGKLRIENLSTEGLSVSGVGADGEIDGSSGDVDIGGNEVRKNLVKQFNELRDQLDKLADDASFNGINLLRGDKLKLTFNETGSSTIEIQARDEDGDAIAIDNGSLGIDAAENAEFDDDSSLDARLSVLADAMGKLRSQSSAFGSNLSIVQNRTDFTKKMINTLETGAANLTLADTNEEAANLLALQTRQQLSSTALSMASQSDQAVLRLF